MYYLEELDLQPIIVTKEYIEKVKSLLPPLPKDLLNKFITNFKLSKYDATIIVEDKKTALFYDELCNYTKNYKAAANFLNGTIKSYLKENAITIENLNIGAKKIADLILLIDENKISNSIATAKIFPILVKSNLNPKEIADKNNWIQESDSNTLIILIDQVINKYPEKTEEYRSGKKGLLGLFMGEVMKLSKGKADPKLTNKLLREKLD